MQPKVYWTDIALEDLEILRKRAFLSNKKDALINLKMRLTRQIYLIQQFPLIGMASLERPKIRQFRLNDYFKIVYEPREELIIIHALQPFWMKFG